MYAQPQNNGYYILTATNDAAPELYKLRNSGVTSADILDGAPGVGVYTVTEKGLKEISKQFTVALAIPSPEVLDMYKAIWELDKADGLNVAPEWFKEIDTVS
jgi:DNA-binding PadR family transcriptional regulator